MNLDLFENTSNKRTVILFFDTETTGIDVAEAEVCELAVIKAVYDGFHRIPGEQEEFSSLVRPSIPIPPEASAIHHITDNFVEKAPGIDELSEQIDKMFSDADLIAAHNLQYDLSILERQLPDIFGNIQPEQHLDTLRLARHVWPDLPSYALQVLRYRFNLARNIKGDAHRALFDAALVQTLLELVYSSSLTDCDSLVSIAELARSPLDIQTFSFGKYRGKLLDDIIVQDPDYVRWLLGQEWAENEHPDLFHTLKRKSSVNRKHEK